MVYLNIKKTAIYMLLAELLNNITIQVSICINKINNQNTLLRIQVSSCKDLTEYDQSNSYLVSSRYLICNDNYYSRLTVFICSYECLKQEIAIQNIG